MRVKGILQHHLHQCKIQTAYAVLFQFYYTPCPEKIQASAYTKTSLMINRFWKYSQFLNHNIFLKLTSVLFLINLPTKCINSRLFRTSEIWHNKTDNISKKSFSCNQINISVKVLWYTWLQVYTNSRLITLRIYAQNVPCWLSHKLKVYVCTVELPPQWSRDPVFPTRSAIVVSVLPRLQCARCILSLGVFPRRCSSQDLNLGNSVATDWVQWSLAFRFREISRNICGSLHSTHDKMPAVESPWFRSWSLESLLTPLIKSYISDVNSWGCNALSLSIGKARVTWWWHALLSNVVQCFWAYILQFPDSVGYLLSLMVMRYFHWSHSCVIADSPRPLSFWERISYV